MTTRVRSDYSFGDPSIQMCTASLWRKYWLFHDTLCFFWENWVAACSQSKSQFRQYT